MSLRILGIDPGSRITGFGVIEVVRGKPQYITSGCLRVADAGSLPLRLKAIFEGVSEIVAEFAPQEMAIEQVFVRHNIDSALKLGQARGAAICAATHRDVEVFEYAPTRIKQSVVGRGHATKDQVQFMMKTLLQLSATPQEDAADALACALCHFNSRGMLNHVREARA